MHGSSINNAGQDHGFSGSGFSNCDLEGQETNEQGSDIEVLVEQADSTPLGMLPTRLGPDALYTFHLGFFNGPLDLLLHLVREQEVPVADVKMSVIAEQYLEIISQATDFDLERAGEFLVVAATLLDIKSRSYLPAELVTDASDALADGEISSLDAGFYEELRRRLQVYEHVKQQAQVLQAIPQLDVDTFVRRDLNIFRDAVDVGTEPEEIGRLGVLFMRLVKKVQLSMRSITVRLEPVSVVSMMMRLVDTLRSLGAAKAGSAGLPEAWAQNQQSGETGPRTFLRVLAELRALKAGVSKSVDENAGSSGGANAISNDRPAAGVPESSKGLVIGGFIALLELAKRGVMKLSQAEGQELFVELRIAGDANSDLTDVPFQSEFDDDLRAKNAPDGEREVANQG